MFYRLDVYIHDYLVKRELKASAQAFQAEAKVSSDPVGMHSILISTLECTVLYVLSVTKLYSYRLNLIVLYLVFVQLLMLLVDFCSNGGRFSGTSSLPELMRSTLRLLLLTLRYSLSSFVLYFYSIVF